MKTRKATRPAMKQKKRKKKKRIPIPASRYSVQKVRRDFGRDIEVLSDTLAELREIFGTDYADLSARLRGYDDTYSPRGTLAGRIERLESQAKNANERLSAIDKMLPALLQECERIRDGVLVLTEDAKRLTHHDDGNVGGGG